MKFDHILVLDQTCPKQTQGSLKANAIPGTPLPESTPASLICLVEVYQTFCHYIPKQSSITQKSIIAQEYPISFHYWNDCRKLIHCFQCYCLLHLMQRSYAYPSIPEADPSIPKIDCRFRRCCRSSCVGRVLQLMIVSSLRAQDRHRQEFLGINLLDFIRVSIRMSFNK